MSLTPHTNYALTDNLELLECCLSIHHVGETTFDKDYHSDVTAWILT